MTNRVSVLNRCEASFQSEGTTYGNIQLLNLGTDGCYIEVPEQAKVSGDSVVEGWSLSHPLLPSEPIQARVIWANGSAREGYREAEVLFLNASDGYRRGLKKYVNLLQTASPECTANDLVGMP